MGILAAAAILAFAQAIEPEQALVAMPIKQQSSRTTYLPANTEVNVSLNQALSTKSNSVGETFYLTVTHDVTLGNMTVIPRGSRATGEITWMTGKGMFGKSGKFEIEIRYIDVGGRRVPVTGKFRQEGNGNTVATVGAVVVVPVAGFFVTGKSGEMPRGRELTVFTESDIPVILPDG